jgi:hypothetical protein
MGSRSAFCISEGSAHAAPASAVDRAGNAVT